MKFFELIPNNLNIDFIGKFKLFLVISLISVGASITGMFTRGFNFGIDFTGGTAVQVRFTEPTQIEQVRKLLDELGEKEASVVSMDANHHEYLITGSMPVDSKAATLPTKLVEKGGGPGKVAILQADVVGPKVGAELKLSAIRSLVYAIILIMVYIWFRFDFKFAPGATVALVHDVIVASGYYIITQQEFDITAVAALLTIAGYGVNDTIVIYDRVREMMKVGGDTMNLPQTINRAINMTLSRTVITSGLVFFSVLPVAVFCTGPIQDFAETMLIGIFIGTYSTYYIAAPMTIYVDRWMKKRNPARGRVASV